MYLAERLSSLPDDWMVSWGFRYGTNGSIDPEREGDFAIQGPSGHVCVIEVKSGQLRQFALTGYWENSDGENPADQLHAEWKGVISLLDASAGGSASPVVHRALALPSVNFVHGDRFREHLSRGQLLGQNDICNFPAWWNEYVAKQHMWIEPAEARKIFIAAFAARISPKATRFFVNETDSLILRQLQMESTTLDLVADNRQLLVRGACGSGKTFLAVEQAKRWAERGNGGTVLLLCYNLPLADQLSLLVARRPPSRGSITVISWEALASKILGSAGIDHAPPGDLSKRGAYYTLEVPGLLLAINDDDGIKPEYDALVVDEGQDHDTVFPGELFRPDLPGWWTFYLRLLHDGSAANVAVFYDEAQRPRFRSSEGFSVPRLAAALSQPAYLSLPRALRYTRSVFEYLVNVRELYPPGSVSKLQRPLEFREGPEVEEFTVPKDQTAKTVSEIAERWVSAGYCRPSEILVLGQRRERANTSLGGLDRLGRFPLCDLSPETPPGSIPYLNVHRAKGLDRLGVILIGLSPREAMNPATDIDQVDALFSGASRARQLLAVVAEAPAPKPDISA
ncbi:MAG: hypothetical protein WCA95_03620 [Opitutaceae bacterium]